MVPSRRDFAALAFGGGLMAARARAQEGKIDMTPETVRYGAVNGIILPTIVVAEQKGFFKEENLTVETTKLAGAGPVTEALAAGQIDLGNTAPLNSIMAIAKGARVSMVCSYEIAFTDKDGRSWEAGLMVARAGEGIARLEDLRGKRIAVNGASAQFFVLRAALLNAGIDPEKDVKIVSTPFGQMAGPLVLKEVDAIMGTADDIHSARQRVPVAQIGTITQMEGVDISLSAVIGANNAYLQRKFDATTRFLRAFVKARQYMNKAVAQDDPALPDLIGKALNLTPERLKFFWETRGAYYGKELATSNLLDIPRRVVAQDTKILKTVGAIRPDVELAYDKAVDIRPLKRALASLGEPWDETKH